MVKSSVLATLKKAQIEIKHKQRYKLYYLINRRTMKKNNPCTTRKEKSEQQVDQLVQFILNHSNAYKN